jgi:MFS family permease
MAEGISVEFERATYRKVTRRLIPFLFLCYILNYFDRVNIGFAKLQMQQDLAFSDTVYGLGAGIFFLGYFIFEVPSNVMMQRVGARIWIARIMISWGVVAAATMFTNSATTLYVLRFLLGAAEAGFFPAIILYLTFWYTRAHRVRMTAAFMTAIALAGVLGGPVNGWIMQLMGGIGGLANWQWLFLLEGIPSVLVGALALALLDNGPGTAKWLSDDERRLVLQRLEEEQRLKEREGHTSRTFGDALRSPNVWLLCAAYFAIIMGNSGLAFWLPQIIKDTLTPVPWKIGLISAIPWGVAAVAMVVNGNHSDRTGERCWHTALPAIIGGVAFLVSGVPGVSGVTGIIALTVAAAGVLSSLSAFWSLPTGILSGTAAAVGIAWINSVGNLAGYASPFLIGKIRDATGGMTWALMMLAISLVLGGLLAVYITKVGKVRIGNVAPVAR